MLTLDNFSVETSAKTLIYPFTLSLKKGQVVAILGANGAGKSTLLKAIGQDITYQGEINWQAQNLATLSLAQRAQQIAFMPQQTVLNFAFKVEDIIQMGLMMYDLPKNRVQILTEKVLLLFELIHLRQQNYLILSGGEKQRVQAARVWLQILASNTPKLVLLDEPTSALDLKHQHMLLAYANDLAKQQHLVLIVLHDINLASRYCDQLLLLQSQHFLMCSAPENAITKENIHKIYQYDAKMYQQCGKTCVW